MNDLQIFKSEEFGEVRTVTIDNDVWFVGKDVAEKLGYAETANMRKLLEVDEYMEINPQKPEFTGFVQNGSIKRMLLVNESGLYTAIFHSTLEKAKKFRVWVTSEVLPSIRKHGGYINGQENLSGEEKEKLLSEIAGLKEKVDALDELLEQGVELEKKLIAEKAELKASNDKLTYQNEKYKALVEAKAHCERRRRNVTFGEYVSMYKKVYPHISRNQLFLFLRCVGFLGSGEDNWNKPLPPVSRAVLTCREYTFNGKTYFQPLITPYGQGNMESLLQMLNTNVEKHKS